jgi:orotidine-5'-phosphate decarboxylase
MGGSDMISAAKESLEHTNIRLLVVTLLTSISKEILNQELLIQQTPNEVVKQYALNSQQHGADGVISSCLEVDTIKKVCGENFIVVTPGIRYTNQKTNDDQKRIATPMQARKMGSDYIVVGRTITNSEDPVGKYIQVYQEFINHAIQ